MGCRDVERKTTPAFLDVGRDAARRTLVYGTYAG
jgi:hypothetical protein